MKAYRQKGLNEEIVRRVFMEASLLEQRREENQDRLDLIEALQELTDLTRSELEEIIMKVRRSYYGRDRDTFFSVKDQAILVSTMLAFLVGLPTLFILMFLV
jgi:hypothetical protein